MKRFSQMYGQGEVCEGEGNFKGLWGGVIQIKILLETKI